MKREKKAIAGEKNEQAGREIKKDLPVKNRMTEQIQNTASQINGLNQASVTSDDLLPSDGDNLTQ